MSLTLLIAVTAATAAAAGYLVARKAGRAPSEGDGDDPGDEAPDSKGEGEKPEKGTGTGRKRAGDAKKKPEPAPFATLPLALGDVVSNGTDERWLAGAVVAREGDRVIAALFVAPEGKENKAVAAFPPPRKDVWWMSPTEIQTPDEPPATIEVGGVAMSRKARLPVKLGKHGQGAPPVGEEGIWAVYDRGRDVAVVISSGGVAAAWVGVRLEEDEYDRLGAVGED